MKEQQLKEYTRLFFSFNNPIFYSIFLVIVLLVLIYIFFKYVILPLQKNHELEKKELELKNTKLMSLFAELDPDPVLRINMEGIIILCNAAAQKLPGFNLPEGKHVSELLPRIKFNIADYILKDKSRSFSARFNGHYYSVLFRGISSLSIAQLYFHDYTEKKLYEKKLLHYNKRLKYLSSSLQDKLEGEKRRIAGGLHDSIGQNLLLMKLELQSLSDTIPLQDNNDIKKIIESLEKTIADLKVIILDLKPRILEEMGLIPALRTLCHRISAETGINGTVDVSGMEQRLDGKTEITIYRIIQEALNNIIKHSGASEFNIQLINTERLIRLMISDDGKGIAEKDRKNTKGLGLMNMRERIETMKGSFKIDSEIGRGTLLIFEIPKEI